MALDFQSKFWLVCVFSAIPFSDQKPNSRDYFKSMPKKKRCLFRSLHTLKPILLYLNRYKPSEIISAPLFSSFEV